MKIGILRTDSPNHFPGTSLWLYAEPAAPIDPPGTYVWRRGDSLLQDLPDIRWAGGAWYKFVAAAIRNASLVHLVIGGDSESRRFNVVLSFVGQYAPHWVNGAMEDVAFAFNERLVRVSWVFDEKGGTWMESPA